MNLGINDAANLGWKLAYVLAGRAPATLLDSYGTERRPAAQQVMAFTDNLVRFVLEASPVKRTLRRAMMPLLQTPILKSRLANRMAQLRSPPGQPDHATRAGTRSSEAGHADVEHPPARWPHTA